MEMQMMARDDPTAGAGNQVGGLTYDRAGGIMRFNLPR